jgi:hypothetical protein
MNQTSAINNLQALAISKVVSDTVASKAKEGIEVGKHEVNFLVRVQGTVTLGEDYEQEFWQIAKPETTILALICALNGTTADKITQEEYDRIMADVEGKDYQITEEAAARFKKDREANLKKLRQPCKKTAKGKLTAKISGEIVEDVPEVL